MQILENEYLRLIPLEPTHEEDFLRLINAQDIHPRIHKPFPFTSKDFYRELETLEHKPRHFMWMIQYKHYIVGSITSGSIPRSSYIFQGGYWVDADFWKKGVATHALRLVNAYLLNAWNAQRIQAVVETDNHGSARVLEKCGYRQEGLLRKYQSLPNNIKLVDVWMYAIVADDKITTD